MKNINLLVFIFTIIVLISSTSLVSSAKQVPDFPEGFTLRLPQVETFKQNSYAFSRVHVFNTTNGLPITNGIGCYWHLYNVTGEHITIGYNSTIGEGFDYSFKIDGANFSVLGQYYFIIQCNSSTEGGFVAGSFEVTTNGNPAPEGIVIIFFSLLFIIIVVSMLSVLLYTVFQFIALNFNARDLIVNVSIYLGLFATYILGVEYLSNVFVNDFLLFLLEAGAITTVFLPIIAFTVSFIKERMENVGGDKEDNG